VRILVAGGCNSWCTENPGVTSAEMYDPDTNQWSKVADLPVPLNRYSSAQDFFLKKMPL
jgi:hypothetical protein